MKKQKRAISGKIDKEIEKNKKDCKNIKDMKCDVTYALFYAKLYSRKDNIMKKLTVLIITVVFLSFSSLAFAGKDSGPYIGAALGYSTVDVAYDAYDNENFDDNDQGFKIFGGYNFGLVPMFDIAVEASYVDFGDVSGTIPSIGNVGLDLKAYDAFALACYNIGPVGIFGKAGYVWWKMDSGLPEFDESSSDMAYGLGLKFQIKSITVRAEYELFKFDVDEIDDVDLDCISVGISYTF